MQARPGSQASAPAEESAPPPSCTFPGSVAVAILALVATAVPAATATATSTGVRSVAVATAVSWATDTTARANQILGAASAPRTLSLRPGSALSGACADLGVALAAQACE